MPQAKGSGTYRFEIQIMKLANPSTSLDAYGRQQSGSTLFATVKGSITKLSGNEKVIANQVFGAATHQCECWYIPGVTNKMWLIALNNQRFNILDIDDINNRHFKLSMLLASESS